ncbi:MAG TPA: CsgG/HfaB family protein [Burkholderiaceae bacterium]
MKSIASPALLAASLAALLVAPHARAQDSVSNVEKCSRKLGVLAVGEPQQGWGYLSQYSLGSPASLLRMMVQSSGCFDVVERGAGMQNLQQERSLAAGGELRQESNVGKGQMQAADFVMTPNIQIASSNSGGVGGAIGGALLGRFGLGGVAGGLKFKEASTSLLISDVRSSIQVAAAEGKATKTDFDIGGFGFGGAIGAAAGGYTSTPEGKVIAASLLDNYNKIVLQIRDNTSLLHQSSAAGDANAAASTKAAMPVNAGQVIYAKIANVKIYSAPSRDSKVVGTVSKSDEMVASGEVKNGFVQVDTSNASGWVQQTLISASGH